MDKSGVEQGVKSKRFPQLRHGKRFWTGFQAVSPEAGEYREQFSRKLVTVVPAGGEKGGCLLC